MLVLSRKIDEKILIPSLDATIQILEIRGNTVRIGIQAPPDVTILRAELLDRDHVEPTPTHLRIAR